MKNSNYYLCLYIIILTSTFSMILSSCKKDNDDLDGTGNKYNGKTTAVFNDAVTYGTLIDQEGNIYKTVIIGTQIWMAENLRTTIYRNGDPIANATSNAEWAVLNNGAFCNYNLTENIDTIATFGRLYNWYAVSDSRNIAPEGWHVPTDDDWIILTTHLGGVDIAGGKIKETGTSHWKDPNNATNETGFTALPGGILSSEFLIIGEGCNFWSSTESAYGSAWDRNMWHSNIDIGRNDSPVSAGFSVRCVKD